MATASGHHELVAWKDALLASYQTGRAIAVAPGGFDRSISPGETREFVVFDSDADTGDSVNWEHGFFSGGTYASAGMATHPTRPKHGFNLYVVSRLQAP